MRYFHQASLIEPSQPDWQLLMACCYRRAGNPAAELRTYQEVHRRFPDHVDCLRLLSRLCADLDRDTEAHRYAIKLRRAEKAERLVLLSTVLMRQVMQSPPSVCPSVCLFSLYLRNRLTVDLELLRVSRS